MLNFSEKQMQSLKRVSQQEQLLTKIPAIMQWIEERHDTQTIHKNTKQGQRLIEDCIQHSAPYGFIRQTHIQNILDLQYQQRQVLYDQAEIISLHQAHWITPEDRINILTHLLKTKQQSGHYQPKTEDHSLYHTADVDRLQWLEAAIKRMQQAHYAENDLSQYNAPLLQHARSYHLLQQSLATMTGWEAWKSDGLKSLLGIQQLSQKRGILLQLHEEHPDQADNGEHVQIQASIDENDDEVAVLLIKLPQQMDAIQYTEIAVLLDKWALQLYPVKKMQDILQNETTQQGVQHA